MLFLSNEECGLYEFVSCIPFGHNPITDSEKTGYAIIILVLININTSINVFLIETFNKSIIINNIRYYIYYRTYY